MPFSSVPVLLKDAKCIGIYFFWEPCYPFKNSYTLPIWCNEKKVHNFACRDIIMGFKQLSLFIVLMCLTMYGNSATAILYQ